MAEDTIPSEVEPVSGQTETDQQPDPPKVEYPPEAKKTIHERNKENEKLRRQLKEYEDRDKTDAQRAADALAEVTAERDGVVAELARVRAALQYGLDMKDLDLLGSGTAEQIEDRAKRLADRLAETNAPRRPQPDPSQGRGVAGGVSTADQFAAALEGHL